MMGFLGDVTFFLAFLPLGACIGSFLNVVIYRLPFGKSLVTPPSTCPHCNTLIPFKYNIPIFGWLLIGGRSKCCGEKVSVRYPLIELLCGVLWGLVALQLKSAGFSAEIKAGLITFFLLYFSVLLTITFIDIDHQIIPDELDIGGLVISIVACLLLPQLHPDFVRMFPAVYPGLASVMGSLVGALVGGGALLLITVSGTIIMRKKIKELQKEDPEIETAIGLGDVKLMAFIGAATGWKAALCCIFIGCILGGIVGVFQKLYSGKSLPVGPENLVSRFSYRWHTGESLIPFGPYLCSGSVLMFFFGNFILKWMSGYFSPVIRLFI